LDYTALAHFSRSSQLMAETGAVGGWCTASAAIIICHGRAFDRVASWSASNSIYVTLRATRERTVSIEDE